MAFTLYEIWSVDSNGREEIINTASNLSEATRIAKAALSDDITQTIIYDEDEYGEAIEVKIFKKVDIC